MSRKIPKISGIKLVRYIYPLLSKPLDTLESIILKKGGVVEFNAGKYQQLFLIADEEVIKQMLKTNKENYKRSPVIKALKPLLGNGIFISETDTWSIQRQFLKPAFHDKLIREYEKEIMSETNALVDKWSNVKSPHNIEPDIERLMLSLLIKTQFCKSLELDIKRIIKAHNKILIQTSIKNQKLDFFKNQVRKAVTLKPKYKAPTKHQKYLQTIADSIIEHGKAHLDDCSYWLRGMIEGEFSQQEIRDMILNFIFAGYDTTASALSWTLYALSKNQREQSIAKTEAKKTTINFASLSKLNYIKKVVQESMRLYPPVWSIHRKSEVADIACGYTFSEDSYFMISPYLVHRNPSMWQNPEDFNPERFSLENMRGKAFSYIPFGQGERVCIGQSLAIMELQLIVGTLLKKFTFSYSKTKKPTIVPGIIMKSKSGIELDIRKDF